MRHLALRLAAGSGRRDLVRQALLVLAAAGTATALLCAVLVLQVRGCGRSSCTGYANQLVDETGLRPGVALALALLAVPVLVLLGLTVRVSAARRDQRAAALRLAGATPAQGRLLAVLDTAAAAAVGALLAVVLVAVVKARLEAAHLSGRDALRSLPTDVPLPVVGTLAVLVVVPAVAAATAALALRRVVTTPLGVVRRAPAARPTAWTLAPLVLGLAVLLLAVATAFPLALLGLGVLLLMVGLVTSAGWTAAAVARLVAGRARRPAPLLAARRVQADPRAQGRALTAVLLAVLVAAGAQVLRAQTLAEQAGGLVPDDDFYRAAYDLVDLGLLLALAVGAAGLAVALVEQVAEQRRSLAALVATGVPVAVLQRAALLQGVGTALPAVLLAAAVGTAGGAVMVRGLPLAGLLRVLAVVAVALLAVLVATALTLPGTRRAARPTALRAT